MRLSRAIYDQQQQQQQHQAPCSGIIRHEARGRQRPYTQDMHRSRMGVKDTLFIRSDRP